MKSWTPFRSGRVEKKHRRLQPPHKRPTVTFATAMRPSRLLPCTLALLGLTLLPLSLPAQTDGPVLVHYHEPMKFTDFRESSFASERMVRAMMVDFARSIRRATLRHLPEGYTIQITFTDIDMAGDFEPQRGPDASDVRIIRDIYPPRLVFIYVIRDATGEIVADGEEAISDLNFQQNVPHLRRQDPFVYEEELFRRWVSRLDV